MFCHDTVHLASLAGETVYAPWRVGSRINQAGLLLGYGSEEGFCVTGEACVKDVIVLNAIGMRITGETQ